MKFERGVVMNKKGILFDLDGTLINTYENINYKQVFDELKSVQKTLLLKIMKSRVKSYADLERKIMREAENPSDGVEIMERVTNFLMEHYNNIPLKKDAIFFLDYLKKQGYTICLCTNNATDVVEHIVKEKNIKQYFDYIITSQQVTKAKPDPQMYLEAMHHIQLDALTCCVFEDSETGVDAARNAGIEDIIVVCDKDKKKFEDCIRIHDFSDHRLYELF